MNGKNLKNEKFEEEQIFSKWTYWDVSELEKIFLTMKFDVFQSFLLWSGEPGLNRYTQGLKP